MNLRNLPPPTKFTIGDAYRLLLGGLAIVLGLLILWRATRLGISPPALLVSLAFVGFGIQRLYLGGARLWQLRRSS